MSLRALNRFSRVVLLVFAGALTLTSSAAAYGPEDVEFSGGSLDGVRESADRTQFSFENLNYTFSECGKLPNELTCTWSIEVVLNASPPGGCAPAPPASTLIWSSGEQFGNGTVDSGPQGIGHAGCPDQAITVSHGYAKTYGPWEGDDPVPYLSRGGGWSFALLPLGVLAEAEQAIIDSSPAARPTPMPTAPDVLRASADCRSLYKGQKRYAFKFRGIGCWKATRLAQNSWLGASPTGYQCTYPRGTGEAGRCANKKKPRKFYAWHPPRKRAR